jgi:hypothetical protein
MRFIFILPQCSALANGAMMLSLTHPVKTLEICLDVRPRLIALS